MKKATFSMMTPNGTINVPVSPNMLVIHKYIVATNNDEMPATIAGAGKIWDDEHESGFIVYKPESGIGPVGINSELFDDCFTQFESFYNFETAIRLICEGTDVDYVIAEVVDGELAVEASSSDGYEHGENFFFSVDSSSLDEVMWNDNELFIRFKTSNKTYQYHDVPVEVFAGLLEAKSKGKFFNDNIKGVYDYSVAA